MTDDVKETTPRKKAKSKKSPPPSGTSKATPEVHDLYNPDLGPRDQGLNRFAVFLCLVWAYLGYPPPTTAQLALADRLQYGPKRDIVMMFRGCGKTHEICAFVIWLWLINAQWKMLMLSASEKKAAESAGLIRQILAGMPELEHLRPQKEQLDNALSFNIGPATPAKDPSINVAGIGGQVTGGHTDFIFPDDVETADNCNTVDRREKLIHKVTEFESIIKKGGRIIYPGTPHTEQSLYLELQNKGYDCWIWTAKYPEDVAKYRGKLAPQIAKVCAESPYMIGKTTDPSRFSDEDLVGREIAKGPSEFKMQFMLDPSLADEERYPLKLKDLIVMSVPKTTAPAQVVYSSDPRYMINDPTFPVVGLNGDRLFRPMSVSPAEAWLPFERSILGVDPAGAGGKGDELGLFGGRFLKGMLYGCYSGGLMGGGTEANMTFIARKAIYEGYPEIASEWNFSAGTFNKMLEQYVEREYRLALEAANKATREGKPWAVLPVRPAVVDVKVNGIKELRILGFLEALMAAHKVIMDESVFREDYKVPKQANQLFYQMTRLTRDRGSLRKDDRLDAMALCVQLGFESLRTTIDNAEELVMEAQREELVRKYLERANGRGVVRGGSGGWLNQSEGEWLSN